MLPTILTMLVFCSGLLAWAWILPRWRHGDQLLPLEPHSPVPWDALDLLAFVIIYVFVSEVCLNLGARWSHVAMPTLSEKPSPEFDVLLVRCNVVISALTFIGAMVFIHFRVGATLSDFGFGGKHLGKDLWSGVVAFAAIGPVVYLIQDFFTRWISYEHPLIDELQRKPDALTQWIAAISAVVVAPVFEEFMFRGILQGWLEKMELRLLARSGVPTGGTARIIQDDAIAPRTSVAGLELGTLPILISSMLFALIHLGQGAAPIALYVFALALGYLYRQTHRLWPSMTVHFLLNAVTLVALLAGGKS